jgi:hypothetical protein
MIGMRYLHWKLILVINDYKLKYNVLLFKNQVNNGF